MCERVCVWVFFFVSPLPLALFLIFCVFIIIAIATVAVVAIVVIVVAAGGLNLCFRSQSSEQNDT